MKIFKKGAEYNNLAKGFNGVYMMLNELEAKVRIHYGDDFSEFNEEVFIMAYLCKTQIMERLEEYGWSVTSPIIVPMISKGRVTVSFAIQQTVARLNDLAEQISMSDEVSEILDGGNLFHELQTIIPANIKNSL